MTIDDSPFWTWYGNQSDGGGPKPLPLSDAYAAAQAGEPSYNQYAAVLNNSATPLTDSYGFPFTDRFTAPLAPLDADTTLTLTILPDTVSGTSPVPEPRPVHCWPTVSPRSPDTADFEGAEAFRAAPAEDPQGCPGRLVVAACVALKGSRPEGLLTSAPIPTSGQTLPDRSYVLLSRSIVLLTETFQRLRANIVPGYVHNDAHPCCNPKMTWKRPRISAPRPSIVAQRFALQRRIRFFRL